MAPVATNESDAPKSAVQALKDGNAQPINPFYSPSTGDDVDDTSYEFARYKVSSVQDV